MLHHTRSVYIMYTSFGLWPDMNTNICFLPPLLPFWCLARAIKKKKSSYLSVISLAIKKIIFSACFIICQKTFLKIKLSYPTVYKIEKSLG